MAINFEHSCFYCGMIIPKRWVDGKEMSFDAISEIGPPYPVERLPYKNYGAARRKFWKNP